MSEKESMRDAYGNALLELGRNNPDVVVLDSDVSNSTKTVFFAEEFPERFYNFGIQEANMTDAAAGMASLGLIPFINTFAFLAALRAAEQIRTSIAYNDLNVKIVGSYGGLSDSYDGASHQSVMDLAVMRSMPHLKVIVATDAVETRQMVKTIGTEHGPVYLRLCRNDVPRLFGDDYTFRFGQSNVLREGGDLTLVVTGVLVDRVLQAAENLSSRNIQCRVLQVPSIKPVDEDAIVRAAEETGALVSVEEHSVIGGLGSTVAEVLGSLRPAPLERVGISDTFAESGDYDQLLDKYGMSVEGIEQAANRVLKRKR